MTLGSDVARQAQRRPGAVAVFDEQGSLTWRQLDERTNRLANALAGRFGVGRGDKVALLCPNRSEVVEVAAAAHKLGAVYVGLNCRLDHGDLAAVIENAEPVVVIAEDAGQLEAAMSHGSPSPGSSSHASPEHASPEHASPEHASPEHASPALVELGAHYEALLAGASPDQPATVQLVRHGDLACIVYTSGTTGRPKGVMFDHAAMQQHATVACLEYEIGPQSRYLVQIPHNSSVNITVAPCVAAGAAIGFSDSRRFDPDRFAATVAAQQVSHTFLVPTQLMRMLDQLPAGDHRLSSISTLGYGSSPISPDRLGQLVERFGPVFIQLYGMAEVASIATLLRKDDHLKALSNEPRLLASCGQRSYALAVRVVDDGGADVPVGERGEVVFAGPHVMLGYHRDPERTAEVLIDGWMHSGDIAELDEQGYCYIVDRKKHLIIRGGLNIVPTEVENVLYRHDAVAEVTVFGAPDPEWGEKVMAEVTLREAASATPEELRAFVAAAGLATIKVPEEVRIVAELPKNAVGKIDKMAVRARYWQGARRV